MRRYIPELTSSRVLRQSERGHYTLEIEGVGQLEDDFAIRQVGSAGLTVNQEQIVSWAVDPVESKVEIHQFLDAVVLYCGTGQPIVGEVVVHPDVADVRSKIPSRQLDIIKPVVNLKGQVGGPLVSGIETDGGSFAVPEIEFSLGTEEATDDSTSVRDNVH